MALSFVPSWQFEYPATPDQPTLSGLGIIPSWQFGINAGPGDPSLRGVGDPAAVNAFFESWAWQNRKWLAFGAVIVAGAGLVALLK